MPSKEITVSREVIYDGDYCGEKHRNCPQRVHIPLCEDGGYFCILFDFEELEYSEAKGGRENRLRCEECRKLVE